MVKPQAVGKDKQPSPPVTVRIRCCGPTHRSRWHACAGMCQVPRAGLAIALALIGIPASWFLEKLQPAGVCPETGAIMVARVGLGPADWTIIKALGQH